MRRATYWIRWVITAYFAVIAAVGTGLHTIPGCDHPIEVGHGCGAFCGLHTCCGGHHERAPCSTADTASDADHDSPVRTASDCPICRLVATASQVVQPVLVELALPLVEQPSTIVDRLLAISVPRAFAARAPPLALA